MKKNNEWSSDSGRHLVTLILVICVIGSMGGVECRCEEEEEKGEKGLSKKYKIGAIVSILISSAIGVSIPMVGKTIPALHPEKDLFFLVKAFAAGVILSTGFIHVLPDAFEKLTCPCLTHHPWLDFPFTGFVAMVAAIGTLIIDSLASAYFKKSSHGHLQQTEPVVDQQHHVDLHLHTHSPSPPLLRYRVISQVLELGIVVHSVIIGISLGASENPKTIRPLIAALTFHQFFEGMGLGGCISQAKFKKRAVVIMALLFSLTTPVGIAIGMLITNGYKENNQHVLIVEGILNAASAGILIYMSLVDLLAADLMHPRVQSSGKLQIGFNASLLLGAASMSVLAIWA